MKENTKVETREVEACELAQDRLCSGCFWSDICDRYNDIGLSVPVITVRKDR